MPHPLAVRRVRLSVPWHQFHLSSILFKKVDESGGWMAGTFVPVSCIAVFTVLVETVTKVTATLLVFSRRRLLDNKP